MKPVLRIAPAAFCLAFCLALPVGQASAQSARDYVSSLTGKWSGGGTLLGSNNRKVTVRCRATNSLNKGSRLLALKGRCASSRGNRSMRGSLRYSSDGARITSANLRVADRGGNLAASLNGTTLSLSGSETIDGKSYRTRTIISGGGNAYTMRFQARMNGVWKNRGTLRFTR